MPSPIHGLPTLHWGDWLFGLVVLAAGGLLPLVVAWRRFFGTSSDPSSKRTRKKKKNEKGYGSQGDAVDGAPELPRLRACVRAK